MENEHIAVWFSCGAASAVAAKLTVEKYGAANKISIVNNPVAEEHPDNRRFLADVESWIGVPIEFATNANYPDASAVSVWAKRRYMSGVDGAPCTIELKKVARQQWEARNRDVSWHVMGFTVDERNRHERFTLTERDNVLPVLIDAGLSKDDCARIISDAGLQLPAAYALGYPNANCEGCVKATSPTYWNLVRRVSPEAFAERSRQSRDIGCKLVRHLGKRIYLDELPEDAVGRPLKSMKMPDCGIFCEEREFK